MAGKQARVVELLKKHSTIEKNIHEENKRPSADEHKINELKKMKLQIKDQIAKITGVSYKSP